MTPNAQDGVSIVRGQCAMGRGGHGGGSGDAAGWMAVGRRWQSGTCALPRIGDPARDAAGEVQLLSQIIAQKHNEQAQRVYIE